MKKEIKVSQLLDVYGKVLKPNHFDALDYYYNQDLSLSEISEILKMTRQGIWDLIKRSEMYLFDLELKLGFLNKYNYLKDNLSKIKKSSEKIIKLNFPGDVSDIKTEALKIKNISENLMDI